MLFGRTLQQGDRIRLKDGRRAEFQFVAPSPYPAEERAGVQRAYVWSDSRDDGSWADWILPSEIKGVSRPWHDDNGVAPVATEATTSA